MVEISFKSGGEAKVKKKSQKPKTCTQLEPHDI